MCEQCGCDHAVSVNRDQIHDMNNVVYRDQIHDVNNVVYGDQIHDVNNVVYGDQIHMNNVVYGDQIHDMNSVVYWTIQAGLLTPLTFVRHCLSPLAAFASSAYFLHNGRR